MMFLSFMSIVLIDLQNNRIILCTIFNAGKLKQIIQTIEFFITD